MSENLSVLGRRMALVMLVTAAIAGLVSLIFISILVGVSLDTEAQRRARQRVADERRNLAAERQRWFEQQHWMTGGGSEKP